MTMDCEKREKSTVGIAKPTCFVTRWPASGAAAWRADATRKPCAEVARNPARASAVVSSRATAIARQDNVSLTESWKARKKAESTGEHMSNEVRTLCDIFTKASASGKPDLLLSKVGGVWKPISAKDFGFTVRALSLGLNTLGIQPGDRV